MGDYVGDMTPHAKNGKNGNGVKYEGQMRIFYLFFIPTAFEIFLRLEVESRHFRPLYYDCRPLADERPAIST